MKGNVIILVTWKLVHENHRSEKCWKEGCFGWRLHVFAMCLSFFFPKQGTCWNCWPALSFIFRHGKHQLAWPFGLEHLGENMTYRTRHNWHLWSLVMFHVHFRKWKVGPMFLLVLWRVSWSEKNQVNTEYGQWKSLGMISMSCCYVVEFQGTKYHDGTAPSQFKQMSEEDRRWGPFHETDVKHIF